MRSLIQWNMSTFLCSACRRESGRWAVKLSCGLTISASSLTIKAVRKDFRLSETDTHHKVFSNTITNIAFPLMSTWANSYAPTGANHGCVSDRSALHRSLLHSHALARRDAGSRLVRKPHLVSLAVVCSCSLIVSIVTPHLQRLVVRADGLNCFFSPEVMFIQCLLKESYDVKRKESL